MKFFTIRLADKGQAVKVNDPEKFPTPLPMPEWWQGAVLSLVVSGIALRQRENQGEGVLQGKLHEFAGIFLRRGFIPLAQVDGRSFPDFDALVVVPCFDLHSPHTEHFSIMAKVSSKSAVSIIYAQTNSVTPNHCSIWVMRNTSSNLMKINLEASPLQPAAGVC